MARSSSTCRGSRFRFPTAPSSSGSTPRFTAGRAWASSRAGQWDGVAAARTCGSGGSAATRGGSGGSRAQAGVVGEGEPVYADAIELEPARVDAAAAGILDGRRYLASGFWFGAALSTSVGGDHPAVLIALGHAAPNQVYLRALAEDGVALADAVRSATDLVYAG